MDVRYYIKHPNGRERLKADGDTEALMEFLNHWARTAKWVVKNPKFELIKETRQTLATD